MKQILFSFVMFFMSQLLCAQESNPGDSISATSAAKHITLEGIEIKGDIYDFSKVLQKNRFTLKTRKGDSNYYIFSGTICGQSCYFKVNYSKDSRTVYSIVAEPKSVNINDYVDSLNARYGEYYDYDGVQYKWQTPVGGVLLKTPEGYDPILVIMDAEGVGRYKEER